MHSLHGLQDEDQGHGPSGVSPPATATAGSPIDAPLPPRDASNTPLPDSYPIETDLPFYRIIATGLRDGLPTTLTGLVSSSTLATIIIPYVGNFIISITSSLTNPQILQNGAFQNSVDTAPTDPASSTTSYDRVITAGSLSTANFTTFDAFDNSTTKCLRLLVLVLLLLHHDHRRLLQGRRHPRRNRRTR